MSISPSPYPAWATVKVGYLYPSMISPQVNICRKIQDEVQGSNSLPQSSEGGGQRHWFLTHPSPGRGIISQSSCFWEPRVPQYPREWSLSAGLSDFLFKLLQVPNIQGYSMNWKLLTSHFVNRVVTDSYKMDIKCNATGKLHKVFILVKNPLGLRNTLPTSRGKNTTFYIMGKQLENIDINSFWFYYSR